MVKTNRKYFGILFCTLIFLNSCSVLRTKNVNTSETETNTESRIEEIIVIENDTAVYTEPDSVFAQSKDTTVTAENENVFAQATIADGIISVKAISKRQRVDVPQKTTIFRTIDEKSNTETKEKEKVIKVEKKPLKIYGLYLLFFLIIIAAFIIWKFRLYERKN